MFKRIRPPPATGDAQIQRLPVVHGRGTFGASAAPNDWLNCLWNNSAFACCSHGGYIMIYLQLAGVTKRYNLLLNSLVASISWGYKLTQKTYDDLRGEGQFCQGQFALRTARWC